MRSNPKRKKRGNVYDRHARNRWLRSPESGFGGDGETVKCVHGCGRKLDESTVEADRVLAGESYARWNIQPACRSCNASRGNAPDEAFEAAVAAAGLRLRTKAQRIAFQERRYRQRIAQVVVPS